MAGQPWLLAAGGLSAIASLLHVGCILGGGPWYRFFGAGEAMARAAERGSPTPAVITAGIAMVLAVWAAYAFSAAGLIPRLPLIRTALLLITGVYLLRGLAILPMVALQPTHVTAFWIWSSLIVLAYGAVHAVGLWLAWPGLSASR